MRKFFEGFLKENKGKIIFFSLWRFLAFAQVLFAPYAFSQIINILSQNPGRFKDAIFWAGLMILNNVIEDFNRLKSKCGLEKLGARLKISLATFFTQKTRIRFGKKTGEAVQTIKHATEEFEQSVNFYKDNLLELPVNFIIIPLILLRANPDYLILLSAYALLYLVIDYFAIKIYNEKMKKYYRTAEIFWGTTYRKTPEIWRKREDGESFTQETDREGKKLYDDSAAAVNIDYWRWIFLQALSSASIGGAILFVIYKIINGAVPIGDLILVSAYFGKTQETLNIITTALTRTVETKIVVKRLNETVKIIL